MGLALNGAGQIKDAFAAAGVVGLPAAAFEQFDAYLQLLLRWNTRLNLTAIRDTSEIIGRHFVECAFAAQRLPQDVQSLLDFGSGAGFPGIPIAICRPEIAVTLAEAQGKKASFLREVCRALSVSGEVYDGRVEMMPDERRFGAVSLRAVEKMPRAIPVAVQRATGYLVLFTTVQLAAEYRQFASGFEWWEDVDLPNATQRILAVGQRV